MIPLAVLALATVAPPLTGANAQTANDDTHKKTALPNLARRLLSCLGSAGRGEGRQTNQSLNPSFQEEDAECLQVLRQDQTTLRVQMSHSMDLGKSLILLNLNHR